MFIDAWLGLLTAVNGASYTEFSGPGYGRQPISFGLPRNGLSKNSTPYSFGFGLGTIAGRALFYDATGGMCLATLALAAPRAFGASPDAGDAGSICLMFNDLAGDPTGAAQTFAYAPGAVIGNSYTDPVDFTGMSPALSQSGATLPPPTRQFATGPITVVSNITISRGILQASITGQA